MKCYVIYSNFDFQFVIPRLSYVRPTKKGVVFIEFKNFSRARLQAIARGSNNLDRHKKDMRKLRILTKEDL